jgi:Wound-induced protein
MISGTTKNAYASMLVAASIAAVEALKDQLGLCRWNYAMRSVYQHASNRAASLSLKDRAMAAFSSNSKLGIERESGGGNYHREKRYEEKLEKAYHLICWGPN